MNLKQNNMIVKKSLRTVKPRKTKEQSVSQLKKRLDSIFSVWVRTRDGGQCYTCGIKKPIKEMQNGHYVSRGCNQLRYDERNCHCQCVGCNIFKSGNMTSYALALIKQYSPQILQELDRERRKIKQWTKGELLDLIEHYATT